MTIECERDALRQVSTANYKGKKNSQVGKGAKRSGAPLNIPGTQQWR